MKKYNAFIFDLDGTLVHTLPEYRYTIVGQTLRDLGVSPQNELIDRFWFEARRGDIVTDNWGLSLDTFWSLYRKYDTTELRKKLTKVYDDVSYVQELKKAGFKTGIVTGAPLHIAELEIDMLGKENFDAIVVAHRVNGFKPKPHPHGLEECLGLLKSQKEGAVYIGNADEDVETAKNAKVFDVLLDRGEHKFPTINPSLTIHSLYELRQLI
ncbi:MAG: HAD family hydrolase [Candidatus Nanoarchaeia archaeon]|nr:HAD family hydrolase [Candidatus Nanoarchaeia archaeon]MDD5740899.1 HAD family hydrolase [Candidatus Nanoarchaeia archaeon]